MAKARAKAGKPVRTNHFDQAMQPQFEADATPHDVGHKMVKAGKATHPHWRQGRGGKHATRMYSNANAAHGHTKVGPHN